MDPESGRKHQELLSKARQERTDADRGVALDVLRRTIVARKLLK